MKRNYVRESLEEMETMHDAYNEVIAELAEKNSNIVLLYADFPQGPAIESFQRDYPDRVYDLGIAEANLITTAAGLAAAGKIPFTHCHSIFGVGRAYNQIRQNVAYDKFNVKMVMFGPGMLTFLFGASHQGIEDIAALRLIPNLVVIRPADPIETSKATRAVAEYVGPVVISLERPLIPSGVPVIYSEEYPFELSKAVTLVDGEDATIIATGTILADCLEAADILAKEGINVRLLDMHTIKPIDKQSIIKAAEETGAIVTVEDGSIIGGLGGAVAEIIVENSLVPVKRVGIKDRFGRSGTLEELKVEYEISARNISEAVREVIKRKV